MAEDKTQPISLGQVVEALRAAWGHCLAEVQGNVQSLQEQCYLKAEGLVPVCEWLQANYFDHLACLSGVDNGAQAGTMEVVYHLYSIPFHFTLVLKVLLPRNQQGEPLPSLPSVSHIWRGAEWHEREAYDLLGIHFSGHPDLRRILLPDNWTGHPLRKDDTPPQTYHGIKVAY
jgi:NADH-quinone oxidoreductase subunit C